jgi:YebC/PmpR family DNA-binding regulatory protein
MSGHNKWSKIKRKKAGEDAAKSKAFSKISRVLTMESKKCNGLLSSPSLATAIESAKAVNMPKDTIDRAIKKGTETNTAAMDRVTYECFGPGGVAMVIEGLTDNRNRTAQEIRHALSEVGIELGAPGSAVWAFQKSAEGWEPTMTVPLSDEDAEKLGALVDALEDLDDVQEVFANVE